MGATAFAARRGSARHRLRGHEARPQLEPVGDRRVEAVAGRDRHFIQPGPQLTEPGKRASIVAVEVGPAIEDVEEYLVSGIDPEQVRWVE